MSLIKLNNYASLIAIGLMILGFDRCVEPFIPLLEDKDTVNLLVVEGLITNETGPFGIHLSSTVPVYNKRNILEDSWPVSGAGVQIVDDRGNVFMLYEHDAGWYETEDKNLKGIQGNTYTLMISTPDGKQYQSTSVWMLEGPEIDSLHFQEFRLTHFDLETPYEENWLNILVKQHVIRRDFYNYFKRIRESNEETGGIYERTPAQILGNIHCCDEDENALGYFNASVVKTKRIFIHPTEHNVSAGYAYGGCGWTSDIGKAKVCEHIFIWDI